MELLKFMLIKQKFVLIFIVIIIIISVSLQGCLSFDDEKTKLKIFHAGSLSGPLKELEAEFEKKYKNIDVQRESTGSAAAIRKITDLDKKADILASADYSLIETMMVDNDPQYATWHIQFALNQLVIAYTDHSTANDAIAVDNWPNILKRSDVNFGFSNPNHDPCGYRALMMLQLAENVYNIPNLFDELVVDHTSISVQNIGNNFTINAPENLDPDSTVMIRPKEVDLMALLESGELDYLIIYRSVAYQHQNNGVKFLILPDAIDLSNSDLAINYSVVSLQQYSDQPGKGKLVKAGPVVYGITIPTNAAQVNEAISFVKMLLSKKGQDILNRLGQPPIVPARVYGDNMSEELAEFVT